MRNKISISSFINIIQNNKLLKLIIIFSSLILPTSFLMAMMNTDINIFTNPYIYLWIGFYDSILLITCFQTKLLNKVLIIINILTVLFLLFLSIMGGIQGFITTLIKMIFPFIPHQWLWDLVIHILPPSKLPPV